MLRRCRIRFPWAALHRHPGERRDPVPLPGLDLPDAKQIEQGHWIPAFAVTTDFGAPGHRLGSNRHDGQRSPAAFSAFR